MHKATITCCVALCINPNRGVCHAMLHLDSFHPFPAEQASGVLLMLTSTYVVLKSWKDCLMDGPVWIPVERSTGRSHESLHLSTAVAVGDFYMSVRQCSPQQSYHSGIDGRLPPGRRRKKCCATYSLVDSCKLPLLLFARALSAEISYYLYIRTYVHQTTVPCTAGLMEYDTHQTHNKLGVGSGPASIGRTPTAAATVAKTTKKAVDCCCSTASSRVMTFRCILCTSRQ